MTEPVRAARPGPDDVRRIAALARIEIDDAEAARLAAGFGAVLGLLETIRAVDTTGVEPLVRPLPAADVLRDDVPRPGLGRDAALADAPESAGGAFRVPPVRPETGA